jgi:hypothetical protein
MSLKMEKEVLSQNLTRNDSRSLDEVLRANNVHTDKLYKPEKQYTLQRSDRRREVKTDLACPVSGARISVKGHGLIELCSIGMLQSCDYLDVSLTRAGYSIDAAQPLKEDLLSQPKRLIGALEKDQWKAGPRKILNFKLESMMNKYPNMKREIVKTALLGEGIYEGDAIPTHVATPKKFVRITKEYIDKVTDICKIDIRLKGRGWCKVTNLRMREPSLRIGLNMKSL